MKMRRRENSYLKWEDRSKCSKCVCFHSFLLNKFDKLIFFHIFSSASAFLLLLTLDIWSHLIDVMEMWLWKSFGTNVIDDWDEKWSSYRARACKKERREEEKNEKNSNQPEIIDFLLVFVDVGVLCRKSRGWNLGEVWTSISFSFSLAFEFQSRTIEYLSSLLLLKLMDPFFKVNLSISILWWTFSQKSLRFSQILYFSVDETKNQFPMQFLRVL